MKVFYVAMSFCAIEILCLAIFREQTLRIFTNDEAILNIASTYFYLIAILMFFDYT